MNMFEKSCSFSSNISISQSQCQSFSVVKNRGKDSYTMFI